jgi:hypothetical protein
LTDPRRRRRCARPAADRVSAGAAHSETARRGARRRARAVAYRGDCTLIARDLDDRCRKPCWPCLAGLDFSDRTGHERTATDRDVLFWIAHGSHAHNAEVSPRLPAPMFPGSRLHAEYGFQTDGAGSIPVARSTRIACLAGEVSVRMGTWAAIAGWPGCAIKIGRIAWASHAPTTTRSQFQGLFASWTRDRPRGW